jgi:VWFA-related protein
VAVGVVSACLLGAPSAEEQAAPAQGPVFLTRVTVVPLDVRVVDRHGNPVNDLTKDDFLVFEDGVRQAITHFERQVLTRGTPGPRPTRSTVAPFALDVQNRRVVYIELGRLWLGNARFGLVEALTKFLRERLLPQDYAVVSSFGRMTDLTTDHEALAQVVERIGALHAALQGKREPTIALYGWRRQPEDSPIRRALDGAFAPASSSLRLSLRPAAEFAMLLDRLGSNFVSAEEGPRIFGDLDTRGSTPPNPGVGQAAQLFRSDMLTLLGALQYLRFIEGEKHLVYFQGIAPKAVEDDRELSRIANEARVAVHVLARTNGLPLGTLDLSADMSAKNIAEWTGGSVFINRWPDETFSQIDAVTRSGYLLAYSPTKTRPDERYRKIAVRVTRPEGAKVMVRESYRSTGQPPAYDPATDAAKQQMLTVAEFPGGVDDLGVVVSAKSTSPPTVTADVAIDVARVQFSKDADRHVAKLELALFCNDGRERLVGQRWVTLDLRLTDDTLAKLLREGFKESVTVPVTSRVRYVKAVVYDYGTGRAGAGVAEMK